MGDRFIAATSTRNLPVEESRRTIDALPLPKALE
jgi:hypothetical protein